MTRFEFTREIKDVDGESGPIFVNDIEDEDEPEVMHHRQKRHRQYEPSKKVFIELLLNFNYHERFLLYNSIGILIQWLTCP